MCRCENVTMDGCKVCKNLRSLFSYNVKVFIILRKGAALHYLHICTFSYLLIHRPLFFPDLRHVVLLQNFFCKVQVINGTLAFAVV